MRTVTRTLLTTGATLIWVAAAAAQAPGPRPAVLITEMRPMQLTGSARSPSSVIERLMSFDVNEDARISGDELPERMQELVARGDKNADATLDADEIRMLVNAASSERSRVSFGSHSSEGLLGVISDLKLPPAKHARALVIVGAHIRRVTDPASSVLLGEMKARLDEGEYADFLAAATRLSRSADFRFRIDDDVVRGVVKAKEPR